MTRNLECTGRIDPDAVHRYVAGTLAGPELSEFELHLLGCDACAAAVREGAAIRAALAAAPVDATRSPAVRRGVPRAIRPRHAAWALPLAAAAALLIVVWPAADPVRRLGRIDAVPAFEPLPVRADPGEASRLADAGMSAYVAGDYREAASRLAAAAGHAPGPGVHFFLGIARLRLDEPAAAADALRAALLPVGNAYAPEARFYLAKALLRSGRADSALVHLAAVPAGTALGAHAAALADSVRLLVRP